MPNYVNPPTKALKKNSLNLQLARGKKEVLNHSVNSLLQIIISLQRWRSQMEGVLLVRSPSSASHVRVAHVSPRRLWATRQVTYLLFLLSLTASPAAVKVLIFFFPNYGKSVYPGLFRSGPDWNDSYHRGALLCGGAVVLVTVTVTWNPLCFALPTQLFPPPVPRFPMKTRLPADTKKRGKFLAMDPYRRWLFEVPVLNWRRKILFFDNASVTVFITTPDSRI